MKETQLKTPTETAPAGLAEFDGGSFAITHLSHSPEGFEFVTDETVPKTEGLVLNADDKKLMQNAVARELKFNGVDAVRTARQEWAADRSNPELKEAFYDARKAYQNKGKKVGLRKIHVVDNELHAGIQVVHFPTYNIYAQPDQGPEKERLSRLSGVAMAVRTADGRLIVQHRAIEKQRLTEVERTRGNATYTDIPGASVAGMIDASINTPAPARQPGMPDRLDTGSVRSAILKEAGEELGLEAEQFTTIRIAGVAEDRLKVHDEILLLADTTLTANDVKDASRLSNRNKNLGDADFEEKFVDIEATPEAIALLLTEVHCPLPPTHAATLVAAGYSIALQTHGEAFAQEWRNQVELGVRENYAHMDQLVTEHYRRFPKALRQVPERFWGKNVPNRNPEGYSPAYGPEEQGLPTFEDEMVRTGLMPETRETVPTAYLFDVDGPISDPHERRVVEEGIFTEIISRLKAGEPVGLNSGRSVAWMEQQVVSKMQELIEDKSLLERFIVIGEKGGSWLTFDKEGQPVHGKVDSISIPEELAKDVDALVAERYSDCVANLDPKLTMLSLEMLPGYDLGEFGTRKQELAAELQQILQKNNLAANYAVDATTIAVDIESPHVGKDLGADRFLQHLADLGIKPESFITFGDSVSDADMAEELVSRGRQVELVYVGSPTDLPAQDDYPVRAVGGFSTGTIRYLEAQAASRNS